MSRLILILTLLLQLMILPEAYGQRLQQERKPKSGREVVHVDFNRAPSSHVQMEPLGKAVKKSAGDARRTAPKRARQAARKRNRPIRVQAQQNNSVIVAERSRKKPKAEPTFEVEEAPLDLKDALRNFRTTPKSKLDSDYR